MRLRNRQASTQKDSKTKVEKKTSIFHQTLLSKTNTAKLRKNNSPNAKANCGLSCIKMNSSSLKSDFFTDINTFIYVKNTE